jgi:luciferase family oxidoreductase group 1
VTLQIGILDYGLNHYGLAPRAFHEQLLTHVRGAEAMGFTRYWLAEHQAPGDSWATPQLSLMWLAQQTASIKLGSAGILLDYHAPIHVAGDFNLLEHLFPGRIDLGVARGRPFAPNAKLLADRSKDFSSRLADLTRYFTEADIEDARVLPRPMRRPHLWALGTSDVSMELALQYGMNYAHSIFHPFPPSYAGAQAFAERRGTSGRGLILAVAGACSETAEMASRILAEHRDLDVVPRVSGDLPTCAMQLDAIMQESCADEIVFLDVARSFADRQNTRRLLARLIG